VDPLGPLAIPPPPRESHWLNRGERSGIARRAAKMQRPENSQRSLLTTADVDLPRLDILPDAPLVSSNRVGRCHLGIVGH
jgi:hypothetical protein